MNTAVINLKTDPILKRGAQEVASSLGVNLSMVINNYLRDFVNQKSFTVSKSPYGIFKNSNLSNKDINDTTSAWDNILNDLN